MTNKPKKIAGELPDSRGVALEILLAWAVEPKPIDFYVNSLTSALSPRDRAFTRDLVYTVLRQKQCLDQVISRFSKHPLRKMKPRTLAALEIGVAQLLFNERIPSSAAVNSTVDALKKSRQPSWLLGFVNGLLRSVAKNKNKLIMVEDTMPEGKPLLNHPEWMVERWYQRFGKEVTEQFCRVNNIEPPLNLRVNSLVVSKDELLARFVEQKIEARNCRFSPNGLVLPAGFGAITSLPGFDEGAFTVQDSSAQLATLLLGLGGKGERILDACAGLGGKTTHMAQLLGNNSQLVAVEPDARRVRLLQQNVIRLKLSRSLEIIQSDLEGYANTKPELFDAVLLDVPCSGTGVIRRKPDIRWTRTESDLVKYSKKQLHLLDLGASLLKPGGRLLYATCSLEAEENEDIVSTFLALHSEYSLVDASLFLPDRARELLDGQGYFRPLPSAEHDGFFAAVLARSPGCEV